jgi:ABC-type multidrug transport system fused ATPase/permease subunit
MHALRYLLVVIEFSTRVTRWVYTALALALTGTLLEFVGMTVLVPLTQEINHSHLSVVSVAWRRAVLAVGIQPDVKVWFEVFLGLILVRVVFQFVYSVLAARVSREMTASLSSGAFARFIGETPLLDIQKHQIGHFIAIAGDEANRAGQIFLYFSQLLIALFSVLVTIAAMLVFSPVFAAGVAVFVVVTGVTILRSTRRVYRLGPVIKAESRVATSTFLDGLNGLRSVRSIGGEKYVVNQYTREMARYQHTLFRIDLTTNAQKSLPLILLLIALLGGILAVSPASIAHLDLPSTLAAMVLLIRFFPAAGAVLNYGMKMVADLRASHDVVAVASAPPLHEERRAQLRGPVREIRLRGLTFAYEGAAAPVLDGLEFTFRAGRSYAITGESGSGKSTLVDLLLGLIPSPPGQVLVDDTSLSDVSLAHYRKRVVLVEQQSRLFNDTFRNNIVFGLEATEAEVDAVVRLAALEPVVRGFPAQFDTVIDYQGTNLSGGQRQRLGIARALLRRPDVLILDESTSALDGPTRDLVLTNILAAFADKIVIVVSHDPAVIARMQEVLELRPPAARTTEGAAAAERPGVDAWPADPVADAAFSGGL